MRRWCNKFGRTFVGCAEDAFRDMKTPLAERPIFHRIERRVDAHIFVCVLAYHLLVSIEKTLLDQNIHLSCGRYEHVIIEWRVRTPLLQIAFEPGVV